ncbi:hypothetical protein NSK_005850 [Nannochloropsis salina CCMP1776]|uniref:eIF3a PCI domain-containing protein n=1 Tax=Nannochloropsis salina CCMP1776 TaxID=1027361 RepID=A0A4D9CZ14_9STRA|nr:hypothetical protein NSK_005850 [Nannochloropsis salina CCMP1776]|eukprot:TFJ82843.1 hypothetical protein NSK_005850 [Nannochloropsis salina CCMP1776]
MASYFGRMDKPEGALKRAQDLISVGNKTDALKLLHDVIGAKRYHRQWQQTYEGILLLYLELCVDLKEHRAAKDGLHQYRNMSLQHVGREGGREGGRDRITTLTYVRTWSANRVRRGTHPPSLPPSLHPFPVREGGDSLEKVIVFYVDLAERRAGEARQKADAAAVVAASAQIADLENDLVSDPESIMLSTMTEDSSQERTERDVMVPWLRFLWETYRAVLEVLRTMQKLEKVYHSTCEKALAFCRSFDRTREFHSLCETLSNHLSNLLKSTHPSAIVAPGAKEHRPKGWEQWTSESIELHLQTEVGGEGGREGGRGRHLAILLFCVYHTVKISHLKRLLQGLLLPFTEVEQLIVAAVNQRQIKVRVDYRGQCLHFGEAELEGDSMRYQLQALATQLARVSAVHLSPPDPQAREAARAKFIQKVLATMEAQHLAVLARKETIERQKVEKERERQRRREVEHIRKAEEEKRRLQHESRRMEEEKKKREEEKKKQDEEAQALESVHSKLKDVRREGGREGGGRREGGREGGRMGLASKVDDMKDLDAAARKRELDELVLQQQNAKKEEARKLAEQAKRAPEGGGLAGTRGKEGGGQGGRGGGEWGGRESGSEGGEGDGEGGGEGWGK